MNMKVKIAERWFDVEIGDLQARPIIAIVDGERIEVWPEQTQSDVASELRPPARLHGALAPRDELAARVQQHSGANVVLAPMPGVIIALAIEAGMAVNAGDELCVLEAMKMKNSIRAPQAGRIAVVRVAIGQHVQYHDVLLEYA